MKLPKSYPVYFERRKWLMLVLLAIVIVSGVITYYSFKAYTVYHIYSAFIFAVSLVYLSWLYFNPFCALHKEHFEINSGLFSHKKFTYRDIQKIETDKNQKILILIFNDFDSIMISIKPIHKTKRSEFIELIKIHVFKDLLERDE
ncbi:MAG: hypothetical protein KatS3mg027_1332 [Bacteroidia bacterium]|nr:MAG: hypothetical protein KatS3mg027_1332 [Bacteroidia bacterium]